MSVGEGRSDTGWPGRRGILEKTITRWVSSAMALAFLGLAPLPSSAQTQDVPQSATELKKFSLEELFAIEVTSVSKKPEKLPETPPAVHLFTPQNIRRSGA